MGKYDKCTKCSCEICSSIKAEPLNMEKHGAKLLTVKVRINDICPDKKIAVAVIIYDQCNRILAFKGFTTMVRGKKECDEECGTIERKVVFVLPDRDEFDPCELNVCTLSNYIYPCEHK